MSNIIGTDQADNLVISNGDTVVAGAGNDVITLLNGQPVTGVSINTGAGDDQVTGNISNSTFYYNRGDGHDLYQVTGENNTIVFGSSIKPEDLIFSLDNKFAPNYAILSLANGQGSLSYKFSDLGAAVFGSTNKTQNVPKAVFADGQIVLEKTDVFNLFYNGVMNPASIPKFLTGSDLQDSLTATNAKDWIYGLNGNDILSGLAGDDRIEGGMGSDKLYGGDGADYLLGGQDDDRLEGGIGVDSLEGGDGADYLLGGVGDDLLKGGAGNDYLNADSGADQLFGGAGNDTYVINGNDTITENVGEGTDTVNTCVNYTLTDNVENLVMRGTAGLIGTGNALSNSLRGSTGNDTLNGLAGYDVLNGGLGNDLLVGGEGNDVYRLERTSGQDTIVENGAVATNNDRMTLSADIAVDQVWLSQQGNDLLVSVIGTDTTTVVKDFYLGSNYQVERIVAASGQDINVTQINALVSAMASMTPPAMGQTTLSTQQHAALDGVIAVNWG